MYGARGADVGGLEKLELHEKLSEEPRRGPERAFHVGEGGPICPCPSKRRSIHWPLRARENAEACFRLQTGAGGDPEAGGEGGDAGRAIAGPGRTRSFSSLPHRAEGAGERGSVDGEADHCSPCPVYRPWAGSQGAREASPTFPASGENLRTTTPIGSTSGEVRGGGLAPSPASVGIIIPGFRGDIMRQKAPWSLREKLPPSSSGTWESCAWQDKIKLPAKRNFPQAAQGGLVIYNKCTGGHQQSLPLVPSSHPPLCSTDLSLLSALLSISWSHTSRPGPPVPRNQCVHLFTILPGFQPVLMAEYTVLQRPWGSRTGPED
ncbi:unnamed protein product [Pleuronectes platessa]|uniref:Uncharacterized protein n=1 Tax=Pleuronectes platessa TaxID=8262 RepID=A0A9N7VDY8_PLEPL|nr:unnamed protein product [Pleuronectes platessa]